MFKPRPHLILTPTGTGKETVGQGGLPGLGRAYSDEFI